MKIRKRLRMSFLAMLFIPLIILSISNMLFYVGIERITPSNSTARFLLNKVNFLNVILESNSSFSREISKQIMKNPDDFLKKSYISKLQKSINSDYSSVVIRKDSSVVYASSNIKKRLNKIALPRFGEAVQNYRASNKIRIETMILSQQDFHFKDGSDGSVFYILNPAKINGYFRRGFLIVCIYLLAVIAFTDGILTYLVSKSIIKPLNVLGKAANEIKQGNLDYEIKKRSQDEIGEVCDSFEEMRLRLKDSLELQQHYEENRKELISNISHDLRTPITSIKGYVEGIRDGVADTPEKMDRYISTIYNKAIYMDNLIEDLFIFSKLDLNRLPFNFQNINIVEFIRDYIEETSFDLDKNSIELDLEIPKKVIKVNADVQKIRRVLMNIIENSIKYKREEKLKIRIVLVELKDEVLIKIKDNGKGISKEAIDFIFDRFYREDVSRDTFSGGTGLGLAIVKKIIEEHGGRIWVESDIGVGTTMFFTLIKEKGEI